MFNGTLPQMLAGFLIVQAAPMKRKMVIVWNELNVSNGFVWKDRSKTHRKTNTCSCLLPTSSSSTTTSVSFFFLKSNLLIFCQKNRPILCVPSNTRMPCGVRPKWYSLPSFPYDADRNKNKLSDYEIRKEREKCSFPLNTYHHRVHINTISIQTLCFIQEHDLCFGRCKSNAILELIQYHELQIFRLAWHKPKLGYCCRRCSALFIVTKFGYTRKKQNEHRFD